MRDHKVKVRNEREEEMYRTAITHRDIICVRYEDNTNTLTVLTLTPATRGTNQTH